MRDQWMVYFEDASQAPEVFTGDGAQAAARKRFSELSLNWACHLFRSVNASVDDFTLADLKLMGAVEKAQWPHDFGYHRLIDDAISSISSAFRTIRQCIIPLSKEAWIDRYGGQALLDSEKFDVVPCLCTDDAACRGWRVESWKLDDPRRGVKA